MALSLPPSLSPYPITPDRRYFVVRGRLWRMTNPELPETERTRFVADLMRAHQAVKKALRLEDSEAVELARYAVDGAQPGGTRPAVVDRWRPRLQPAHGAQHAIRTLLCSAWHGLNIAGCIVFEPWTFNRICGLIQVLWVHALWHNPASAYMQ